MKETIIQIIIAQIGCMSDDLTADTDLVNDLDADSLDVVCIVSAIEDAFSIQIEDRDVEKLRNVNDIVLYVEERLNA